MFGGSEIRYSTYFIPLAGRFGTRPETARRPRVESGENQNRLGISDKLD